MAKRLIYVRVRHKEFPKQAWGIGTVDKQIADGKANKLFFSLFFLRELYLKSVTNVMKHGVMDLVKLDILFRPSFSSRIELHNRTRIK